MIKLKTLFVGVLLSFSISVANAVIVQTEVKGSDAIWLAGRIDIDIPSVVEPWPDGLMRHDLMSPEELLETLPSGFFVNQGDVIKVLNPASGSISFVLGFERNIIRPDGKVLLNSSHIDSFGGISGYIGTRGALVGVFLDNNIPNGEAPATLDFSNSGLGIDFNMLAPELGQVFFIGNGVNSANLPQEFIAPTGATRLFLGVPDAFDFNGAPGYYDDNDGSYTIRFGINEGLDTDRDGMLDSWEIAFGLDPFNPKDAFENPDVDGASNLEEFLAGSNPKGSLIVEECTLDVDGDRSVNSWADGLLFIRHMYGLSGSSLVQDAVGNGCTRCSSSSVEVFLDQCAASGASDIDGNGEVDALSDGLLAFRYIFGSSTHLIDQSVGDGCERCTAAEVEVYLEGMMP